MCNVLYVSDVVPRVKFKFKIKATYSIFKKLEILNIIEKDDK